MTCDFSLLCSKPGPIFEKVNFILEEIQVKCQSLSHVHLQPHVPQPAKLRTFFLGRISIGNFHRKFSRQEYWSGLPFPSPGDLPNAGMEPGPPAWQADSLSSEPPRKPHTLYTAGPKEVGRDSPGNPVTKTLLPMQRAQVQSLLRERDRT